MKKIWTYKNIEKEALKYNAKTDFIKKSSGAYQAAWKLKILDKVCQHMNGNISWTDEEIFFETSKHSTKKDFYTKNPSAYNAALRRGILNKVCSNMPKHKDISGKNNPNFKHTREQLMMEALKFHTRTEFYRNSPNSYEAALRTDILDEVCSHMKPPINTSLAERSLFDLIKEKYPKTQKLRDMKVKLLNRPYIRGFEIDIYIPELRKGIEFDGKYWHSVNGLKRGRPNWPEEDLKNYHQIKDEYFKSKGIQLLHIDEKDWLNDKESCLNKCFTFFRERK